MDCCLGVKSPKGRFDKMYILPSKKKKNPIHYSLKSKNLQGEKTDKPCGKMESLLKTESFCSFHRSENISLNEMAEEHLSEWNLP